MGPGQAKGRGWWRRNLVGLIAIVPMMVAVLATNWNSLYWQVWKSEPRLALNTAPQAWVPFSGAEMRLVEFGPAGNLTGSGNRPVTLPKGVTAWKAVVEFKAPDQESVAGCEIRLEDSQGRLYGLGADEISGVRGQTFITCTKPSEQDSTDYRTTMVFVTPEGVKPVAVQIRWVPLYPRFVRLNVPQ